MVKVDDENVREMNNSTPMLNLERAESPPPPAPIFR